jgi:adenylate cyclase
MGPDVPRVERRLAAIFAADVAGYSRLMHEDEVGTLRTLTAHREIMDGLISEYGGRIANTAGDSVLAEFPSIVDAVECAALVQEKLRASDAIGRRENGLQFRIGIHAGDVMVRGHDLLGDGVNIAARIQALAAPGGVMLSGRAYDEIVGKLDLDFEDWGEQQVKNITRPVRVYALVGGASGGTAQGPSPSLPDKPSVAVLPFANLTGDADPGYLADGIVEELIAALSRVRSFFVISRNSTFTYKGKAIDPRQVSRELGVRYVASPK